MDVAEAFEVRVMPCPNTGCWLWAGSINDKGYASLWDGKKNIRAHRFSFEMAGGVLVAGLVLDHKCRNRGCVNPVHLEQVTNKENILRGESPYAKKHRSPTCMKGHQLAGENLYTSKEGHRFCRACRKGWRREWKIRNGIGRKSKIIEG